MDWIISNSVYIIGFGCWLFLLLDWYIKNYVASKVNIQNDLMKRYIKYLELKKQGKIVTIKQKGD